MASISPACGRPCAYAPWPQPTPLSTAAMTSAAILGALPHSTSEFIDITSALCDTAFARRRRSRGGDYGSTERDVKPHVAAERIVVDSARFFGPRPRGASMRIAKFGACVCLALLASAVATAQRPRTTMFEGARLIIGDGRVIENGAIIVENGRIARVGRTGDVPRPAGAERVDLAGKTVMPTLVDAHLHVGYENMNSWQAENYTRENVIDTLERLAYYGVGAVFSTGTDPNDLALQIQRDQAAGRIGGARLVFAAGFGPPGAGPNGQLLKELAKFKEVVVRGITNDADARRGVREVAAKGIPFIKVWVTDRGGTQVKTKPEAYRALIDEAHKHGIRVVAHATDGLADAKDLARAGLDGSIHAILDADQEFAQMMKKNNAFLTPAQGLGLRGNIPGLAPWYEDPFFQEATPPATIDRYRRQAAQATPAAPDAVTLEQRFARVR